MTVFGQVNLSVDVLSIFREAFIGEMKWGLIN